MNKFDISKNIAFFLLEKTGSIYGVWMGRLKAEDQRKLFGSFLGKGKITINSKNETVSHTKKIAFGNDFDQVIFSLKQLEEKSFHNHETGICL